MLNLRLKKVDYQDPEQVAELLDLLQMYALDPMGGGGAIDDNTLKALPEALASRDFMHSFIVYEEDTPLGFSNCIESFSTFSAKGVMNIHDFAIVPQARGKDLSQFLLKGIEEFASNIGCTKLTLEVLTGNKSAIRAYEKSGFSAYQLNPDLGDAMFWQKSI